MCAIAYSIIRPQNANMHQGSKIDHYINEQQAILGPNFSELFLWAGSAEKWNVPAFLWKAFYSIEAIIRQFIRYSRKGKLFYNSQTFKFEFQIES